MNKKIIVSFFISLLPGVSLFSKTEVESDIFQVTVYQDRAVVARRAEVMLGKGVQEVVFENLPVSLLPESIQVSGSSTVEIVILDVNSKVKQLESAGDSRVNELQMELRQIALQLIEFDDRKKNLENQGRYLESIRTYSTSHSSAEEGETRPAVEDWKQLVGYYSSTLEEIASGLRNLNLKEYELNQRQDALNRELRELRGSRQKAVQTVSVKLQAESATTAELLLKYAIHGAQWWPVYDTRVKSSDKSIEFGYSAFIRQSTGEDWLNVDLVLSTAKPSLGGNAPEIDPWILDKKHPEQSYMDEGIVELEEFRVGGKKRESRAQALTAQPRQKMARVTATVESTLTSAVFTVPYKSDIPSDNARHKVGVVSIPLKGVFTYTTVPKLNPVAFLKSTVKNTSEYPFLAGDVNLYLDGNFVSTSRIETILPTDEFDLFLGVDEAIKVERKLINRFEEDTGVINRKFKINYEFEIVVTNNRKTVERIEVQDQFPQARHEDIKVIRQQPDEKSAEIDDQGIIVWKKMIQSGRELKLPLKFSIEYPSDFPISGLE